MEHFASKLHAQQVANLQEQLADMQKRLEELERRIRADEAAEAPRKDKTP